jgi:hypothetical protein
MEFEAFQAWVFDHATDLVIVFLLVAIWNEMTIHRKLLRIMLEALAVFADDMHDQIKNWRKSTKSEM